MRDLKAFSELTMIYELLARPDGADGELRTFYVGQTKQTPQKRVHGHYNDAKGGSKELVHKYIRKMDSQNLPLGFAVLDSSMHHQRTREIYWMNALAALGEPIQNQDGIVLPENTEFAPIFHAIKTHSELRKLLKAILLTVRAWPFSILLAALAGLQPPAHAEHVSEHGSANQVQSVRQLLKFLRQFVKPGEEPRT